MSSLPNPILHLLTKHLQLVSALIYSVGKQLAGRPFAHTALRRGHTSADGVLSTEEVWGEKWWPRALSIELSLKGGGEGEARRGGGVDRAQVHGGNAGEAPGQNHGLHGHETHTSVLVKRLNWVWSAKEIVIMKIFDTVLVVIFYFIEELMSWLAIKSKHDVHLKLNWAGKSLLGSCKKHTKKTRFSYTYIRGIVWTKA